MEKPKTNRGEYNAIIKEAEQVNTQLRKLEQKAQQLADRIAEFEERDSGVYFYGLKILESTLEDLAAFDLEDAIPERANFNF